LWCGGGARAREARDEASGGSGGSGGPPYPTPTPHTLHTARRAPQRRAGMGRVKRSEKSAGSKKPGCTQESME